MKKIKNKSLNNLTIKCRELNKIKIKYRIKNGNIPSFRNLPYMH